MAHGRRCECVYFFFLGLYLKESIYCCTRSFSQYYRRLLAHDLGKEYLLYCYVDEMC